MLLLKAGPCSLRWHSLPVAAEEIERGHPHILSSSLGEAVARRRVGWAGSQATHESQPRGGPKLGTRHPSSIDLPPGRLRVDKSSIESSIALILPSYIMQPVLQRMSSMVSRSVRANHCIPRPACHCAGGYILPSDNIQARLIPISQTCCHHLPASRLPNSVEQSDVKVSALIQLTHR